MSRATMNPRRLFSLSLAVLVACASCSHLLFRKEQGPANIAAAGQPALTVPELKNEVMRFADNYVSSMAQAADRASDKLATREAQVEALNWKITQATAAYVNATGQNPVWNALDMVVLAAISRMVIEDAKSREVLGDAVVPLLETHRELESSAWSLVAGFLSAEQQRELGDLIDEWRRQNPSARAVGAVHFREFALALGKATPANVSKPTSLFSLLRVDPFAGLDPATIAIEQSRELAERTVAYAERMPTLLRWQTELLVYQLSGQPDVGQLLSDAGRVSRSLESVSKTAEGLPALVDEQRRAAIDQFFAGVTTQREAILGNLEAHEGTYRGLLGQAKLTLDSGTQMSTALDGTIKSLDAFVHDVSPPESKTAPPPSAPGKPFNVLDYGTTATQVAGMAKDLTALLRSVDSTAPRLAGVSGQAAEDFKRVVDHAFWRSLTLLLTLLIGSVFAALAYRALARRLFAQAPPGPPASQS